MCYQLLVITIIATIKIRGVTNNTVRGSCGKRASSASSLGQSAAHACFDHDLIHRLLRRYSLNYHYAIDVIILSLFGIFFYRIKVLVFPLFCLIPGTYSTSFVILSTHLTVSVFRYRTAFRWPLVISIPFRTVCPSLTAIKGNAM